MYTHICDVRRESVKIEQAGCESRAPCRILRSKFNEAETFLFICARGILERHLENEQQRAGANTLEHPWNFVSL